ncbi:rhodanese-like domain-containing protein [Paucilactobacillus nenjiangensis]|uniref:Rhodanese-like domain-containing protein n=1 Tax=Paucilactobacillus nenjiangensis TaxID=1296540 RepID=A0A5P1X4B4_9LACO|nr:rhodanese-like domain-containing protein [Paucilactobacillus nenjiangensis]QER67321.1 rhodanese-like domain-containing protein [Paucilactobacillus nenjiangensis]
MALGLSNMNMLNILIIVLIAAWVIYRVYQYAMRKKYANIITEEEFTQGMRKAQVIDLREKNDFDRGHIMGARNVPLTVLKQRYVEIRSDLPVYLYDQGMMLSTRASKLLGKKGYSDISILKSGYARWTGKTKTKKY